MKKISKSLEKALVDYTEWSEAYNYELDRGTPRSADKAHKALEKAGKKLITKLHNLEKKVNDQREYINALLEKRDQQFEKALTDIKELFNDELLYITVKDRIMKGLNDEL